MRHNVSSFSCKSADNSPINAQNRNTHLGVLRFFRDVGCIRSGYRVLSLQMIAGGGGFQKSYETWVAC